MPLCVASIYKMVNERFDPLFLTTTPIGYPNGEHGGTGFFFNQNGCTYLVTAKHVLQPEEEPKYESINIWKRGEYGDKNVKRTSIDVNTTVHPGGADIAVVPLSEQYTSLNEEESPTASKQLAFCSEHLVPDGLRIRGKTTLTGYPSGFYDPSTVFPLKQGITIASPYRPESGDKDHFLVYTRTYSGTSGAPVTFFANTGWWWVNGGDKSIDQRRFLIGIQSEEYAPLPSETIDELELQVQGKEPVSDADEDQRHDFNKVVYPHTVVETIQSI